LEMEKESKKPRGLNPQSPEVIDLRRDPAWALKRPTPTPVGPKDSQKEKKGSGEFFPRPSLPLPAT
jgi:hypothetical protein